MVSSGVLFIINLHTKYIGFYSGNRICNLHITIQISLCYVFGLERSVGDTVHMMTIIMDIVHGGTTTCIDISDISDRYNQMFPLDQYI